MITTNQRRQDEGDGTRWRAVLRRDRSATGFVYAVTTTGIYCRPGCASRRPRRENVRFFASASEASRAGYRPCRRCTPDSPSPARSTPPMVGRACRMIADADEPLSLAALAASLRTSPHRLHRAFRRALGITPKQYAVAHRRGRLHDRLAALPSVTTALLDAGYGSLSRAYGDTGTQLGMAPRHFRAAGDGEQIGYAVVRSPLGPLLVAATMRGVCSVAFGDSESTLIQDLRRRFSRGDVVPDPSLRVTAQAVVSSLGDSAPDLPLDIRGTAFQQKVWQALRTIPRGETATYTEVARRIGRPDAVRAVAGACAANSLGVLVPCHRVLRSDGGVGGYRWGVERKRALLEREAGSASGVNGRVDEGRRSPRKTPSAPRRRAGA
ncbi:MAG: bifunctional DNA-binding transcriptional regulator/O6-methylguanine-DNA methyltransferase Ada [Gemmatimonas sp.]